jgi:hypothetical protein
MTRDRDEVLEVLSCEIGLRPAGAPGLAELRAAVRDWRREPGALVVTLEDGAAATAEAVVDAERLCCASIGWDLVRTPEMRLRVSATEEQLDLLQALLTE